MDRIPVVTSFVYSGDRIALVRRSNQVGTYKGRWAGFSGYIERLPIEQAYLELEEEACLSKESITLKGIGIPVPIDDSTTGKNWLVFPFLFEITDCADVKTNWETAELLWVKPHEIETMDIVPGLDTVFKRVWPAFADQHLWDSFKEIAFNKTKGATSLARMGLDVLGRYAVEYGDVLDRHELIRMIRAFAACRPVMGVFPNLAARLLLGIEHDDGRDNFDRLVESLLMAFNDATALSVNNAAQAIMGHKTVFTLSYSEAVRNALIEWYEPGKEVIIAESYPGNEGLILAEHLAEKGVILRTIKDKYIEEAVIESDVVLVGCDAVTTDDEIQNKVGTCLATDVANENDVAIYAVTQTVKICPPDWPSYIEHDMISGNSEPAAIFDHTPISHFNAIITEEGDLTPERLDEIRAELGSVELIPA
ncbi:MAG: hypothetical protein ACYC0V_10180 [Armatimonadota bacterium]